MNYEITLIPVDEIFADVVFNSRTNITNESVMSLRDSILANGLRTPLTVTTTLPVPEGKKYKIICGHRRFAACQLLGMTHIPCFVDDTINEFQAKLLNLSENIDRRDFTILEEARAIGRTFAEVMPPKDIAKILKRSVHWVQRRLYLLKLPPEIQDHFHMGRLNHADLDAIRKFSPNLMFAVVEKLLKRKGTRKNSRSVKEIIRYRRVPQSIESIRIMIAFLLKMGITGLVTEVLLWSIGELESEEIEQRIWTVCKENKELIYFNEDEEDAYKKAFAKVKGRATRRKK